MGILNIQTSQTGLSGVLPRVIYIATNDTLAEVTTAGYLNDAVQQGYQFSEDMMALVSLQANVGAPFTVAWLEVSYSSPNWSLSVAASPGAIVLPTTANYIAHFTNTLGTLSSASGNVTNAGNIAAGLSGTAGTLSSYPSTGSKGALILAAVANTGNTNVNISNAAHGQATVISIPDGGQATTEFIIADSAGTQHVTSGALQVDAGAISSGLSTGGFVGLVRAYPTTATSGYVAMQAAVNGSGNFGTIISNATTQGQNQVVTIPNAGATTANFLLDTGASNIIAMQQFVGLSGVLAYSVGTWTTTRVAQGNYAKTKAQADETAIIGIDITPAIRTAASKGFRLDSFDLIYGITTLALDAHSVTLDRIAYANNVAVSVTSIPITATLATATQANPYLTNATVNTPAFDITDDSKYVVEVTVNAGATSDYAWYGLMLRFSQTIA